MNQFMNAKFLIGVVVLGVVAAGGYIVLTDKTAGTAAENRVAVPSANAKSMRDLLALGGSQKCVFSDDIGAAKIDGTLYVADGRARGDFMSRTSGDGTLAPAIASHIIIDGDAVYVWGDEMAQGIKMPLTQVEAQSASGAESTNSRDLYGHKYDYDCDDWNADPSYFVLPSKMIFMDISGLAPGGVPAPTESASPKESADLPAAASPAGDMKAVQCAACESAGDGRDACRAALQCP